MITLYRVDEPETIRYYSISDRQGHLFYDHTFTASWGVALAAGRERVYVFDSRRDMDNKLQELIRRRIRDGYRVLYTYFRADEYGSVRKVLNRATA
jgi:predicted DNA-binding WGR domain protein